jgi:protein DJ-1
MRRHNTVLIFVAYGTEEMEAVIVADMLRRAGLSVVIAGESEIITCSRGIKLLPDVVFDHILEEEEYQAIILPGGARAADTLANHPHIEKILRTHVQRNALIGAMCSSTLVLANYDLLPGKAAITSHPSVKAQLDYRYTWIEEKIVIDGNFITCQGAGCSFDFACAVIDMLCAPGTAIKIAREIQYR